MTVYNPFNFGNMATSYDENFTFDYCDSVFTTVTINGVTNTYFNYMDCIHLNYSDYVKGGFFNSMRREFCGDTIDCRGMSVGGRGLAATAYAQPWHMDSIVVVCGMQAFIRNYGRCVDSNYHYSIMDTNFNVLSQHRMVWVEGPLWIEIGLDSDGDGYPDRDTIYPGAKQVDNYYFEDIIRAKDFYLALDIYGASTDLNYSWCIVDTCLTRALPQVGLVADTIILGKVHLDTYWAHTYMVLPDGTYVPDTLVMTGVYVRGPIVHRYTIPSSGISRYIDIPDSLLKDTIALWQSPYPPVFKRDNQWIKFSDDHCFSLY